MLKADTSAWNIAKGFPRHSSSAINADLTVGEVDALRDALRNARNAEIRAIPTEDNAVVKWLEDKLA